MFKENNSYYVLTPTGWSDFRGIRQIKNNVYRHIIFEDKTEIKCSLDHAFGESKILAKTLSVGEYLNGKQILYSEDVENEIDLYDLVEVEKENLYYTNNIVSHNCNFLGSTNTLIHPTKIRTMAYRAPLQSSAGLDVYENPEKNGTYFLVADVARGTQNDYSAFIVFDVSTVPYKIVAKYRNNEIKPMLFPNVIHEVAKGYNKAYVLIEVNDIGDQVANALQFDLEYDNMVMAAMRGRAGQILGGGFSGGKAQMGVKTSKAVKATGCSNIKQIIESDKLIIQDYDLINEWSTFILRGSSYEAEEGHSDDLAMCCVLFGWAVQQAYFKELTDDDIRARMFMEQQFQMEQDMAPFGFIDDGLNDYESDEMMVDEYGTKWSPVVRNHDSNW
jgi:hypothetical protein